MHIYINLFNFISLFGLSIHSYSGSRSGSDICSHWNGRRHFLELGDRGELHAQNVSALNARSPFYSPLKSVNNRTNPIIWFQCNLELVTCAECVIRLTFSYSNFSKTCNRTNSLHSNYTVTCPCEHIFLTEPPYDSNISGKYYCGNDQTYRSQTRTILLKFYYQDTREHVFTLQYFSERNVQIISGTPKFGKLDSLLEKVKPEVISTPFFPVSYPRDYGIEHIISCNTENCHVRLEFTDFQLGLISSMEIFDSNGQMLGTYTGEHFRPPIIVSSKSLLIQFRGNGITGTGYRAEIMFITDKHIKGREMVPYTDCGGIIEGPGGAITMMNMIENSTEVRYFDCIWLIKPTNNYMLMKTHISLRVDSFHGMASISTLAIRQGTTSNMLLIELVKWPNMGMSAKNHILPIMTGYYIRLKGVFGLSSRLAIVYSVFNYMNCYIGSEFLCQNNHCISIRLHCDGFDHCGDNSDETASCEEDWAHLPHDRRWYSHKANYYFPKIEQYPDLKTATGIFIISTLGIVLVLSGWMIILYRMGLRSRSQREIQNHLQTINRQDDHSPDEPPSYEAPPEYEEVIKIGMGESVTTQCHRRRENERRQQSGFPESSRSCVHNNNTRPLSMLNTCSTECNLPQSGKLSPLHIHEEEFQEIANQILGKTGYCEAAKTNSERKKLFWRDQSCQTSTSFDYEKSVINYEQASDSTPTPYEECSNEFKDQSLGVSFTLSIPKSPMSETQPLCPKNIASFETNFIKRPWLIFTTCEKHENKQRIKHSISIPESFLNKSFRLKDTNYGSQLHSYRNSFISNTSTFGSDLPIDGLSQSIKTNESNENYSINTSRPSEEEITQNFENDLEKYETDKSVIRKFEVSSFRHLKVFHSKHIKNHKRSNSFNISHKSHFEFHSNCLKRSNSADLLLMRSPR